MKRDFLKQLGLDSEVIDKIMEENGNDIEKEKAKFADYEDIKSQLKNANEKISSFGNVDAIKADVEKYKAEAEKARTESEAKIHKMEMQSKIKDFTSKKKFVNDLTRDSINSRLEAEMEKEESKGKSIEDLLKAVTDGMTNIFVEEKKPEPPTVTPMNDKQPKDLDDAKIRAIMGLPAKKD